MAHGPIEYPTAQQDDAVYSFTPEEIVAIQKHVAKYPTRESAVMPALWIAQEKWGWLPQGAIRLVADTLGMSFAQVYGVATFYTMYLKENKGKHLVEVCTCFTCGECGGRELYQATLERLNCNEDGVSADGQYYVREAECLGACDTAPVVQLNNRRMRFNVDEAAMAQILEELKANPNPAFVSVPLAQQ
jgi:NADH-quinone oxidoreductase subunit E